MKRNLIFQTNSNRTGWWQLNQPMSELVCFILVIVPKQRETELARNVFFSAFTILVGSMIRMRVQLENK